MSNNEKINIYLIANPELEPIFHDYTNGSLDIHKEALKVLQQMDVPLDIINALVLEYGKDNFGLGKTNTDRGSLAKGRKRLDIEQSLAIKGLDAWDVDSKYWQNKNNPISEVNIQKLEAVCPPGKKHLTAGQRTIFKNHAEPMHAWLNESSKQLENAYNLIERYDQEIKNIGEGPLTKLAKQHKQALAGKRDALSSKTNKLLVENNRVHNFLSQYDESKNMKHSDVNSAEQVVIRTQDLASKHISDNEHPNGYTDDEVKNKVANWLSTDVAPNESETSQVYLETTKSHAKTVELVAVAKEHKSVDVVAISVSDDNGLPIGNRKFLKTTSDDGQVAVVAVSNLQLGSGQEKEAPLSKNCKMKMAFDLTKTWVIQNGAPNKENPMHVNGKDPELKAMIVLATKAYCKDMISFDSEKIIIDKDTSNKLQRTGVMYNKSEVVKFFDEHKADFISEDHDYDPKVVAQDLKNSDITPQVKSSFLDRANKLRVNISKAVDQQQDDELKNDSRGYDR